ncbi:hypothetical protein GGS20DRAFT_149480 [Poronia punctata]|nr:hypothetical protein GGS20DRAFT_149480 [Poronia punctata]
MSEDVSRFLSQVKELGERRLEEDEARSRELEEKILQDRKERQARRRERARSISPQKDSPANTPPPVIQHTDRHRPGRLDLAASPALDPPVDSRSRSPTKVEENIMAATAPTSISPTKEDSPQLDTESKPNTPASPTHSGPMSRGLSWQRRPDSQASERPRSRPLSVVAAENASRPSNSTPEPTPTAESIPREQIASTLSAKDPSWFRQTADRGANSAAYRRNQVEDTETVDPSSTRSQLPGMSRNTSGEPPKDESNSRPQSLPLRGAVTSPINLTDAPKLGPPLDIAQSDVSSGRESQEPFSPSLGRTSPTRGERPVSPTKGAGGFVQSALMKRSDSVSKRWNVQSPTGLQRGDSIASNRTSMAPQVRPKNFVRQSSTELAGTNGGKDEGRSALETGQSLEPDSTASSGVQAQGQDSDKTTPPISPSKTMDPRRWSPQKSSWLESALKKPESPKPKAAPPTSTQPAWMAELQKAKAQKASNPSMESGKPAVPHKHQVSIGGLMRSSAPGTTVSSPGLGILHSPSPSASSITTSATQNIKPRESRSPTITSLAKPESEPAGEVKTAEPSSTLNKVKPETPPKKDFRASLKPRAPPPTAASTGSPQVEFKNVFGNLRKTATQNYVAPDELKGNIARGKAALNATGGPQKSELKDEFKESILAKKKEFQAAQSEGRSAVRNNSVSGEKSVPEGLQRLAELGRPGTIKRGSVSEVSGTELRRPSVAPKPEIIPESSISKLERGSNPDIRSSVIGPPSSNIERDVTRQRSSTQGLPIFHSRGGSIDQPKESNVPGRLPGRMSGNLANRFNPALAGLLAKGPPPMTSSPSPTLRGMSSETASNSAAEKTSSESGPGPKLTHMTKNRARGPKRKAPTIASAPATTTSHAQSSNSKGPIQETTVTGQDTLVQSPEPVGMTPTELPKKETPAPTPPRPKPLRLVSASKAPKSLAFDEDSNTRPKREDKTEFRDEVPAPATQMRQPETEGSAAGAKDDTSQPPSPRKLDTSRVSRFVDPTSLANRFENSGATEAIKPAKSFLDRIPSQDAQVTPQPRSPSLNKPKVPLPESASTTPKRQESPAPETEPNAAEPIPQPSAPLGPRPLPKPPGLVSRVSLDSSPRALPQEPKQQVLSSPTPGRASLAIAESPMRSPTKQSADISDSLRDFFGPERPVRNYRVDTASLLAQRPTVASRKIHTLSTQLFQFLSDGKKVPVPGHNERTLFEREMYLCVHSFKDEKDNQMVEVYFWAGDEVPRSAIDDAAIFVSREARSFGGTLIKLRQGKETAGFLQALGGVVIVQRGEGNKFDSLAPHMLCGRRYMGHVVFDEVDFTPSVLCSGFPYVITHAGRCYLWKGKGSSVDELSCARLIGMEFALSGEMEEFEEGREPAPFWDLFDGANRFGSADHWRLKPNYDKYCSRLFLSDAASQQQIVELSTYTQADLHATNIYVIDAFFELYIVVGSQAQSQYPSFHNALDFAQEYAILAAGMEDRPFVPISTVVLEGIPRDMKSVFRKWQDSLSPTMTNTSTGLKRGRSLKIVSLNQALQALSD